MPKLFVHSRADEMIPFSMGRRLFELAQAPKEFLEIGGSHNGGWLASRVRYLGGLDQFLENAGLRRP